MQFTVLELHECKNTRFSCVSRYIILKRKQVKQTANLKSIWIISDDKHKKSQMSENIFKSVHVRPTWMYKGNDDIIILCNTVFYNRDFSLSYLKNKYWLQILFNNCINLHVINLSLHISYPINIPINYINEFAAPK